MARGTAPLFAVFTATGASALALQVVWQRVMTLHTGVDLSSVTTVVAAFMGGLGLGNLLAGWLADRLTARGCVFAFAGCNVGIAAYALGSIWLLHDAYREVLLRVDHPVVSFFVNVLALLVPTLLMGASLPLLARGAVLHSRDIAAVVGRLYAVNTLGAAAGAALTAWYLMGTFGLAGSVRIAAAVNALAALTVFLWARARFEPGPLTTAPAPAAPSTARRKAWGWMALYGVTGAVALGLEVVFFRVVDSILRSNSHTFGHVLGIYLLLFAAGAAAGARLVRRVERPERAFLLLQLGVAVFALLGVTFLIHMPSAFGMRKLLTSYFQLDGYATGAYSFQSRTDIRFFVFAHFLAPLLVMGVPVFFMGAAFPCVQAVVARDVEHLGRQTGGLLFANLCGNFFGSVAIGFWVIDLLGTTGTLKALSLLLGAAALVGLWRLARPGPGWLAVGSLSLAASAWAAPSQEVFWATLRSVPPGSVTVQEDHACATMLFHDRDRAEDFLFINGASQNNHPYDDFHVLIGLTPSLLHPSPQRGLTIGFGIGATPFAMAQDVRLASVDNVELCGGEHGLARELAKRGSPQSRYLLESPRIRLHVTDGRRFLARSRERWDVITADAGRPTSQASGNLHSREFYELIRDRLAPNGVFAQWIPTDRTLQTVKSVFPYVVALDVPAYFGSRFLIASQTPIPWKREELLSRLAGHPAISAEQVERLRAFYAAASPQVLQDGPTHQPAEERVNRDLFPRDEFFLNNPP
jgi:spermidine synthase